MNSIRSILFCFLFHTYSLLGVYYCCEEQLMHDLLIVNCVDCQLCDRMPVTYNHLLEGGYINMPSARMGQEGEIAFGWASVPPYRLYSVRFQLTSHHEITGNYRIFRGIPDPLFGHMGFGDLSDKGANIKIS